jgi:type IV secretory pathway protease TraF
MRTMARELFRNPIVWSCYVLLTYALTVPFLTRNVTNSLPLGYYWCTPHQTMDLLPAGTLVLFTPTLRLMVWLDATVPALHAPPPWLKQVERQEGDELYVVGTHPASIDSRLFGPIPRASVHAVCRALWTWGGATHE